MRAYKDGAGARRFIEECRAMLNVMELLICVDG